VQTISANRYGGAPESVETRRATAERRFRNVSARLTAAVSPPIAAKPAQERL
jgi:hypothetical protein